MWSKGYRTAVLVDLPAFGRPVRLQVAEAPLDVSESWVCAGVVHRTGPCGWSRTGAVLTSRAARWATIGVGRLGRSVDEVAAELGCAWHTVNNEVARWGEALLEADGDSGGRRKSRLLGVDETLFWRQGRWRTKVWCTSVVDVGGRQPVRHSGG